VASTGIEKKVSSIANTLRMLIALTVLNTSFRPRWKTRAVIYWVAVAPSRLLQRAEAAGCDSRHNRRDSNNCFAWPLMRGPTIAA
jgi:hypothetical protein